MGSIDWSQVGAIPATAPQAPQGAIDWSAVNAAPQLAPGAPAPAPAPLSGLSRFTQGLMDPWNASAQLLTHLLPRGVVEAGNAANNWLASHTGLVGALPPGGLDQSLQQQEQAYQASRAAQNGGQSPGLDGYRALGSIAATAPLALVAPEAAATVRGQAALGAIGGAISQPVTDPTESFWGQKALQAGIGAAGGAAVSAGSKLASALLHPNVSQDVGTLIDAGVTPTPGQILGGGWKRAEDGLTSVPVIGDMVKNAQVRAAASLNKAAINRSLAPIGDSLPDGSAGRDAIAYASGKLGSAYDDIVGRIGAIQPDSQMTSDIGTISGMTGNLPQGMSDQFDRIMQNEVFGRIDSNGYMTGEGLRAADSNLGSTGRGYMTSSDADQRQLGNALLAAQGSVRGMLGRVAPDVASDLNDVNAGYSNLLRVQRAASSLGSDEGNFTPSQLQNAVRSMDPSKGKRAFAMGNALMQDLSDPAVSVLGTKVPDSGTPFRHAISAGLAGIAGHSMLPEGVGSLIGPAAAVGGALSLPYTEMGQRWAAALLAGSRPQWSDALANGVNAATPYLAPGLVPALRK